MNELILRCVGSFLWGRKRLQHLADFLKNTTTLTEVYVSHHFLNQLCKQLDYVRRFSLKPEEIEAFCDYFGAQLPFCTFNTVHPETSLLIEHDGPFFFE